MLNFDPHRWIAEHGPTGNKMGQCVAAVAPVARAQPEKEKTFLQSTPATLATFATERPRNPAAILRQWHTRLAPLDFDMPPDGWALNRWRQVHGDSWWIYENFASGAVRDGWSAHDLFGVLPSRAGWGGLCDRLQGARNLKIAEHKAVWSNWGVADWSCVGAADSLVSSGLKLIWNLV